MKKLIKKNNIGEFQINKINKNISVLVWFEENEAGEIEQNALQGTKGELSVFVINNFFETIEIPDEVNQDNQQQNG